VVVSAFAGWALLVAVTRAIPDLGEAVREGNPFVFTLTRALGARLGTALVWLAMLAMWFCGLASVTSNSRMLFAFARDGGLPRSDLLARVSARHRTPHVAVWTSAACALLVALWADAYSAMVALSTLALYASYAIPIACGVWARRRGVWTERGPWNLGRFSTLNAVLALGWTAAISVAFVLPPNQLAGFTFAGTLALLGLYWGAYMRTRFRGPPVRLADLAPRGE
jgi:amino acid transporter